MENYYCEFCKSYTKYDVDIVKTKTEINGIEIIYCKKITYCKRCRKLILVSKIIDENILEVERIYRHSIGLITTHEIRNIVKMYGIGKKDLSVLLGFEETTLTKYLDMEMPTKACSEILISILDYNNMLILLEKNRDRISEKVYKKLMKSINTIAQREKKNKLISTARYIISKTEDITNHTLQKLLYFCQIISCMEYGIPLFEDTCEAWTHGPIYTSVYNRLKQYIYECPYIKEFESAQNFVLDSKDKIIIDAVINSFGMLSGATLRKLTNVTEPWLNAVNIEKCEKTLKGKISNKSILDYAKKLSYCASNINENCKIYMLELLNNVV